MSISVESSIGHNGQNGHKGRPMDVHSFQWTPICHCVHCVQWTSNGHNGHNGRPLCPLDIHCVHWSIGPNGRNGKWASIGTYGRPLCPLCLMDDSTPMDIFNGHVSFDCVHSDGHNGRPLCPLDMSIVSFEWTYCVHCVHLPKWS